MMCIQAIIRFFNRGKLERYPEATMTRGEVITNLENDILAHEDWAVRVTQYPEYVPLMGDYDWHMHWVKVFKNAIYYLEGENGSKTLVYAL